MIINLIVEEIIYKGPADGFWKYNNFIKNIGQLADYSHNHIILHTMREGEARIQWEKKGKNVEVTLANDSMEIIQKTEKRILEDARRFNQSLLP